MAKNIYFVRHGQTLFNVRDKVQGWCDSPLTTKGIEAAKTLGKALREMKFDAVYSSPSERAYDTATYILEGRPDKIIVDARLKEFNFGTLEGEPHESTLLFENRPKDYVECLTYGWVDVGGENLKMVQERTASFFQDLSNVDGNILIVSHGMWIASALAYLDPTCFEEVLLGIKNCSLSQAVEENGSYRVITINQICE